MATAPFGPDEVNVAGQRHDPTAILALADELAKGAIETVLTKSDIELGIETFLRGDDL